MTLMKTKTRLLILAAFAALALSGCSEPEPRDESNLPWSRPASWEGGMPGMGNLGGPGRY